MMRSCNVLMVVMVVLVASSSVSSCAATTTPRVPKTIWNVTQPFHGDPMLFFESGVLMVVVSPGFDGGTYLTAFTAETGAKLWEKALNGSSVFSSSGAGGGALYFYNDSGLVALHHTTGEVKWHVPLAYATRTVSLTFVSTQFFYPGVVVLFNTKDNTLSGYSGGDGALQWTRVIKSRRPIFEARVIVCGPIDACVSTTEHLLRVAAVSGKVQWSSTTAMYVGGRSSAPDGSIIAAMDGLVNGSTGEMMWKYALPNGYEVFDATVGRDYVLVSVLVMGGAQQQQMQQKQQLQRRSMGTANAYPSALIAYEKATGKYLWEYDTGSTMSSPGPFFDKTSPFSAAILTCSTITVLTAGGAVAAEVFPVQNYGQSHRPVPFSDVQFFATHAYNLWENYSIVLLDASP